MKKISYEVPLGDIEGLNFQSPPPEWASTKSDILSQHGSELSAHGPVSEYLSNDSSRIKWINKVDIPSNMPSDTKAFTALCGKTKSGQDVIYFIRDSDIDFSDSNQVLQVLVHEVVHNALCQDEGPAEIAQENVFKNLQESQLSSESHFSHEDLASLVKLANDLDRVGNPSLADKVDILASKIGRLRG